MADNRLLAMSETINECCHWLLLHWGGPTSIQHGQLVSNLLQLLLLLMCCIICPLVPCCKVSYCSSDKMPCFRFMDTIVSPLMDKCCMRLIAIGTSYHGCAHVEEDCFQCMFTPQLLLMSRSCTITAHLTDRAQSTLHKARKRVETMGKHKSSHDCLSNFYTTKTQPYAPVQI